LTYSDISIQPIDGPSGILQDVITLWRANSSTLGFFPEGAFVDHAARGWILVARDSNGALCGYLLYRKVRRGISRAVITHLCVKECHRGQGLARRLVDALRQTVEDHCFNIELSCRRDYRENELWHRLGFVYIGERPGRSDEPILIWRLKLRERPLLALIQEEVTTTQLPVVLDANVLYRLQDPVPQVPGPDRTLSEEAKSLEADWVRDEIELLKTDETPNELRRNSDPNLRKSRLRFTSRYSSISSEFKDVARYEVQLATLFPENPNENTRSDIWQLAHAVAGNATFFITQDHGILKRSLEIYDEFGLRVLTPGQLIGRLDEAIREAEYQPSRLAGTTRITISRLHSDQIESLYPHMRCLSRQERIHQFEARLRSYMAQPERYELLHLTHQDGCPLAILIYDRGDARQLSVPMLRVSRSRLTGTILRYLLLSSILTSAQEGRAITRIAMDCPEDAFVGAFAELEFASINGEWVKVNLRGIIDSSAVVDELQVIQEDFETVGPLIEALMKAVSDAARSDDVVMQADIERHLWPAKIRRAEIPTFIVPIKPYWAQHLFDETIARQMLWGAQESLVLSNENVYYRAVRNSRGIREPARILWYISSGRPAQSTKKIRACSMLDEVIIGKPQVLFRRFERLGVYDWPNLRALVEGDLDKDIMALKFDHTELFRTPVTLDALRSILQESEGKRPQLQSPQQITSSSFEAIYTMGTEVNP